jgi:hypothetical protein
LTTAPGDEVNHKHGDFALDAQHTEEKKFSVYERNRDTSYRYTVQFHFDQALTGKEKGFRGIPA